MFFKNRYSAGRLLAEKLSAYKNKKDVLVLGIPRGGIEVAAAIAKELNAKLSVIITKKIAYPSNPEFAVGAASLGSYVIDESYKHAEKALKGDIKKLMSEIKEKYKKYTNGKMPILKGKTVIIADDGLATGHTMLAAIKYAGSKKPKQIIAAIPVSSQEAYESIKKLADKIVCLNIPVNFFAVGNFYQEFGQLSDEDVVSYLKEIKSKPL